MIGEPPDAHKDAPLAAGIRTPYTAGAPHCGLCMGLRATFGRKAVLELLTGRPGRVQRVCVADGSRGAPVRQIVAAARRAGVPLQYVPRRVLDRKAQGGTHQGVLAETHAIATIELIDVLGGLDMQRCPVLVACDGITDPHNLGAIARSAAGAGAEALLIPARKSAPLTATVQKAAAGALDDLPIARVGNMAPALARCREHGFWVFGTAAEGGADLYGTDLTVPFVLVLGSEGSGLRPRVRQECDELLAIPLAAGRESLNVSVAAGVTLFEAVRQRRAAI